MPGLYFNITLKLRKYCNFRPNILDVRDTSFQRKRLTCCLCIFVILDNIDGLFVVSCHYRVVCAHLPCKQDDNMASLRITDRWIDGYWSPIIHVVVHTQTALVSSFGPFRQKNNKQRETRFSRKKSRENYWTYSALHHAAAIFITGLFARDISIAAIYRNYCIASVGYRFGRLSFTRGEKCVLWQLITAIRLQVDIIMDKILSHFVKQRDWEYLRRFKEKYDRKF